MAKFFVRPEDVSSGLIYIEDKDDIRHLARVLRAKSGDEVTVSDGVRNEYTTVVERIEKDAVVLRIVDMQSFSTEPDTRVTLYQGIPKGQKMETVIQKCVELGVDSIVPVFMERTVVVEKDNIRKKHDRWQKIADEAVKQCKRGMIPEIRGSMSYNDMLRDIDACQYDLVLLPYENEEGRSIKDALRGSDASRLALIIGPEGGFSKAEVEEAERRGAQSVTLGKTILRTETAGPAALAMIMYELEL